MTTMATEIAQSDSSQEVFQALEAYPWDSDQEYQHGLLAILGQNTDQAQKEYLTLRARCFYYARKFKTPIDFSMYQQWHQQKAKSLLESESMTAEVQSSSDDTNEKPPYPMTFNEIVELITSGKPVPGIREIPDTVLEGQASTSRTTNRSKPWEQ